MNDAADLKRRYLSLLDELERKERRWAEVEALLVQAVRRLAVAATGVDARIDEVAGRIREAVARGVSVTALAPEVETLAGLLARGEAPRAVAPADTALRQLLDGLRVPSDQAEPLATLAGQLASGSRPDETLIDAIAELLNRVLARSRGVPGAPAEGDGRPERALLTLLDGLELPAPVEARAAPDVEALRRRLEQGVGPLEWALVVDALTRVVNKGLRQLRRDRDALEAFLGEMTERLTDIDGFLAADRIDRYDARRSSDALDQAVQREVAGFSSAMQGADRVDELRRVVADRIEQIARHVEAHRAAEERRLMQAEQRSTLLQHRLEELGREAAELRQSLVEKHARMMRDALTEIPNRMAYEERVGQELERWRRFGAPLCLLLWDIDHFKRINDGAGHAVGDLVLHSVAQRLQSKLRTTDFLARYGGEEFVMLLPGANADAALYLAERIRAAIASQPFRHADRLLAVTVSCGIAELARGDSAESAFDRADAALYKAKSDGRNRCMVG